MIILPLETVDEIVDHLHEDRVALTACSLASSIFLTSARYHLFSELVLDCSSLCRFLELLDVPWCSIARAISRLDIHNKKKYRIPRPNYGQNHYIPIDRARIAQRLQGIKRISFSHMSLDSFSPPFWSLLHDLKGVTELDICYVTERTPFHLFRYTCSLPELEALSITQSQLQPTISDMDQFRPKQPFRIPILDISKLPHSVLGWLVTQNPIPHIETLHIHLDSPTVEILKIRQYMTALGPLIHELCIHLPSNIEAYNESASKVDFSSFVSVQSICFEGCIGQEPQELEDLLRTLFSQIPLGVLRKVSMSVTLDLVNEWALSAGLPDDIVFTMFNWGRLPEILHEVISNDLRELRLAMKYYPQYYSRQAEQSLRTGLFNAFHLRGIFHVDFLQPLIDFERSRKQPWDGL